MKVRSMGLSLVFMFFAAIAVQACRGALEPTSRVAETEGDETISEAFSSVLGAYNYDFFGA